MSSIRLMTSVQQFPSQNDGSSTNSRDQIVGGDCSVVDREWALYSVDGLLNYDLFILFFCRRRLYTEKKLYQKKILFSSLILLSCFIFIYYKEDYGWTLVLVGEEMNNKI
jgi:hypothetical protein